MRAYKVVTNLHGMLLSRMATGKAKVIYKINKWVKAPKWLEKRGYYLFVFRSLKKAKKFARGNNEIYECEVDRLIKRLPQFLDLFLLDLGKIESTNDDFPDGTYMAKKVKLLRKVWPKD